MATGCSFGHKNGMCLTIPSRDKMAEGIYLFDLCRRVETWGGSPGELLWQRQHTDDGPQSAF